MNVVEVEYVGGPLDGEREFVGANTAGEPHRRRLVVVPHLSLDYPAPEPERIVYEREPNPTDDGPRWWYRHGTDAKPGGWHRLSIEGPATYQGQTVAAGSHLLVIVDYRRRVWRGHFVSAESHDRAPAGVIDDLYARMEAADI